MAQQQFYNRPQKKRSDDPYSENGGWSPSVPPTQLHANEVSAGAQSSINNINDILNENNAILAKNQNSSLENTEKALQQEQAPNPLNYHKESSDKKRRGWKANLKKYGPSGGILGGLFGLLFGAGVFLTPSLAIVHLKEVFTEDLNDQVAAMDVRSAHVFRAKLKDLGKKGVCTGVKIRCGLIGMSDRQVENFRKAGIEVETDGKVKPLNRKNNIKSLTFTTSTGEKIRVTNPKDFNQMLIDRNIRNQIRRAYNPLFYSAWDKTAGKIFAKYKTGKSSRLQGDTDEERKKSIRDSTAGETQEPEALKRDQSESDTEDQKKEKSNYDSANEESTKRINESGGFKSVFGGSAKGFLKGLGALGSLDSACTVFNTLRLVEAGAKVIRAKQLVGFAMVFLNFADKVKAGKATEKEATFIGNILTKIDNRKKIVNETSKTATDLVDNPDYGKSGFDSAGAKTAFYNEAPNLTSRSQQFMVGGGLVGTLGNVNDKIDSIIPGDREDMRTSCKVVQNPFVRIGSFIVGGIMAFGSFGVSTAVSIAGSIAISAALPLLEGYLKDMMAGDVVSGDTEGVDAVDATFSGASVLLGDMAMTRGMQPANSKTMKEYQALRTETENEYIAMGIEDAKSTPFDIMNQYSFAGMFARKLLPSYTSASSVAASLTTSLPKLLSTSFNSLIPTSSAVGDFNPERFKKCNDTAYKEIGIDADIFCNVRYVLTPQELAMDTDEVYQWMADKGHVDGDTGEPKSDDYVDWTNECTQRTSGWGEPAEGEENGSEGGNCIDGKGDFDVNTLRHFRVYTMDRSIEQGMDDGPEVAESSGTNGGGQVSIASFNVRGASHDGEGGTTSYETRIKRTVSTIETEGFDVIGFQEFETPQRTEFNKLLGDTYQLSSDTSKDDNGNAIGWNSSKYDLVEQGTQPNLKYTVGNTLKAPWVKLKDKETQQQFYFLNTHDPANVHDKPETKNAARRTANAKEHVAFAKQLGAKDNIPILMTGDYNSSFKARKGDINVTKANMKTTLPYCIMTADGTIKNAFDTYKNREATCPNKNIDWNKEDPGKGCSTQIDHLYYWEGSQPISIDSFGCVKKGDTEKTVDQGNGSDHDTVKITITIPGSETGAVGGGGTSANFGAVNFPLKGSKSVVKNPGIFKNGTTSLSEHNYTAYDILANQGTEVIAFAAGKVSYVSSDRCGGKFLTIWNDKAKLGITYMHLSDHIPMNTTVKPGDHVGTVGSKEAGCGTEHLHIDASTDKIRQPCSRNGCNIEDHFRDIGKDLFTTYEALP